MEVTGIAEVKFLTKMENLSSIPAVALVSHATLDKLSVCLRALVFSALNGRGQKK